MNTPHTESTMTSDRVTRVLKNLYEDAVRSRQQHPRYPARKLGAGVDPLDFYRERTTAYMAIERDFGHLLYSLGRTSRARNIVEFGTSFGISTIYLACAVKDNGGGQVVTTEFVPEKAARARQNLADAGLEEYVDFRVGDAMESLKETPGEIDMLFLDGAKEMYLDVLKRVESRLRSSAIVASDNTDHAGVESFLEYLRNPANGYISCPIAMDGSHTSGQEISLRV